jgi:hypothetical protein
MTIQRLRQRLRLVEVGVLATLAALAFSDPGLAAADPGAHGATCDESQASYVYFHDDNNTHVSGHSGDIDRARKFRQGSESMIWFRDGSQEYVIRDGSTLKQVDAIWRPVEEIGDVQGKLGNQIGELGRQQGELGSQQGLVGTRQGALSIREASLSMREQSDALSEAERADIAKVRAELRQQRRALDKQMRALQKPMRELGERMQPLSREMEVLSQKMTVAVNKAKGDQRTLFKKTIASGVAKPVK